MGVRLPLGQPGGQSPGRRSARESAKRKNGIEAQSSVPAERVSTRVGQNRGPSYSLPANPLSLGSPT